MNCEFSSIFLCWFSVSQEVDSVDEAFDFADGYTDDDHVDIAALFDNQPPQIEEEEGLVEAERKSSQTKFIFEKPCQKQIQLCFDKLICAAARHYWKCG